MCISVIYKQRLMNFRLFFGVLLFHGCLDVFCEGGFEPFDVAADILQYDAEQKQLKKAYPKHVGKQSLYDDAEFFDHPFDAELKRILKETHRLDDDE